MTNTEAAQVIAILVNAFHNARFTEDNAKTYQRLILDLDREPAEQAALALAKTRTFMPVPAEFRAAVLELVAGPARTPEDAWGDVLTAIRNVGAYRPPPAFEDAIVGFCVGRMGWRNLCTSENHVADRARFCELYAAERDAGRKVRLASPGLVAGTSVPALPRPVRELAAGIGRPTR